MKYVFALIVMAMATVAPAAAYAEKDSAQCLSECTKKFTKCRADGGALASCLEARKKCIESCA